jgi:hypothetical protein
VTGGGAGKEQKRMEKRKGKQREGVEWGPVSGVCVTPHTDQSVSQSVSRYELDRMVSDPPPIFTCYPVFFVYFLADHLLRFLFSSFLSFCFLIYSFSFFWFFI